LKNTESSINIFYIDQCKLWNLPHHATQHFPGKLLLCIGMPVMIRNNDATELCITKGQEGVVAGWQSYEGPHGRLVLDTLFVRLLDPPQNITIEGLPPNIVPISKMSQTIDCTMKNDHIKKIEQEQVCVLPNFAMTDYGAQGKSRAFNPVDLQHSSNHHSYYTCLSCSVTAEGTLIIQSLHPEVITGGCSGWLRQEFRELELLDEITKLAFNSELPYEINGHRRNTIIRQLHLWKGIYYVPENTHHAIRWSQDNPKPLENILNDSPWHIVNKSAKADHSKDVSNVFVTAQGSISIQSSFPSKSLKSPSFPKFSVSTTDQNNKRKGEKITSIKRKKKRLVEHDDDYMPSGIL
jgi:hypothetical protein